MTYISQILIASIYRRSDGPKAGKKNPKSGLNSQNQAHNDEKDLRAIFC